MPAVALDGAITNVHVGFAPGVINATQSSFTVGGKPMLRQGDPVGDHVLMADPTKKHMGMSVSAGASTFTVAGKPVARMGDATNCGGLIAIGFGSFSVGG